MGAMAIGTTVAVAIHQMAVIYVQRSADFSVAFQAYLVPYNSSGPGMACTAILAERSMQDIAEYRLFITAMRAVTGQTTLYHNRESFVLVVNFRVRMTGFAELLRRLIQQLIIIRLMGLVAGITLPLCIWCVGVFIFLCQIGVTLKTTGGIFTFH